MYTNKDELRKCAKDKRKTLDMEILSKYLVQKLLQTKEYQQAKNVMLFYPLKNEVNLLSITDDDSKSFYLPKISGDNLLCCKYNTETTLCESCFHTKEPDTTPEKNFKPDLVIVPALAVDINNYRLGYGGGFYDRFLKNINAIKIVCIPKSLVVETIFPNKEYDIPVDIVITD